MEQNHPCEANRPSAIIKKILADYGSLRFITMFKTAHHWLQSWARWS